MMSPRPAVADQPIDEVARFVRAEMERQQTPGLALLVSRHGQPVRIEGFGLSNVELRVPVKPETIFQSGSIGGPCQMGRRALHRETPQAREYAADVDCGDAA